MSALHSCQLPLADRIARLRPSLVRDILSVIDRPGMVSFAGGLPAQWSFPDLPSTAPDAALLQYGASEGEASLREYIAEDLAARGFDIDADRVLILSGSQQGIDLVGKLLIDQGTPVAVELPTYLAALQVFDLFGARYVPYGVTGGLQLPAEPARMVYTIPSFQNPTGHCYSLPQRQALAHWCDRHGSVVFEDDPYRELVYEPVDRTPVSTLLRSAPWIYQSSFSKTLCPGLRIGYLACSAELYPLLVQLKQAADLHTNRVAQAQALELLRRQDARARLQSLQHDYRVRRDSFDRLLRRYFGALARWTVPAGGLFFWLQLVDAAGSPRLCDLRDVLPVALEQGVAFMPGEPFFADARQASGCLRLNFSHASGAQAERGIATLATLLGGDAQG